MRGKKFISHGVWIFAFAIVILSSDPASTDETQDSSATAEADAYASFDPSSNVNPWLDKKSYESITWDVQKCEKKDPTEKCYNGALEYYQSHFATERRMSFRNVNPSVRASYLSLCSGMSSDLQRSSCAYGVFKGAQAEAEQLSSPKYLAEPYFQQFLAEQSTDWSVAAYRKECAKVASDPKKGFQCFQTLMKKYSAELKVAKDHMLQAAVYSVGTGAVLHSCGGKLDAGTCSKDFLANAAALQKKKTDISYSPLLIDVATGGGDAKGGLSGLPDVSSITGESSHENNPDKVCTTAEECEKYAALHKIDHPDMTPLGWQQASCPAAFAKYNCDQMMDGLPGDAKLAAQSADLRDSECRKEVLQTIKDHNIAATAAGVEKALSTDGKIPENPFGNGYPDQALERKAELIAEMKAMEANEAARKKGVPSSTAPACELLSFIEGRDVTKILTNMTPVDSDGSLTRIMGDIYKIPESEGLIDYGAFAVQEQAKEAYKAEKMRKLLRAYLLDDVCSSTPTYPCGYHDLDSDSSEGEWTDAASCLSESPPSTKGHDLKAHLAQQLKGITTKYEAVIDDKPKRAKLAQAYLRKLMNASDEIASIEGKLQAVKDNNTESYCKGDGCAQLHDDIEKLKSRMSQLRTDFPILTQEVCLAHGIDCHKDTDPDHKLEYPSLYSLLHKISKSGGADSSKLAQAAHMASLAERAVSDQAKAEIQSACKDKQSSLEAEGANNLMASGLSGAYMSCSDFDLKTKEGQADCAARRSFGRALCTSHFMDVAKSNQKFVERFHRKLFEAGIDMALIVATGGAEVAEEGVEIAAEGASEAAAGAAEMSASEVATESVGEGADALDAEKAIEGGNEIRAGDGAKAANDEVVSSGSGNPAANDSSVGSPSDAADQLPQKLQAAKNYAKGIKWEKKAYNLFKTGEKVEATNKDYSEEERHAMASFQAGWTSYDEFSRDWMALRNEKRENVREALAAISNTVLSNLTPSVIKKLNLPPKQMKSLLALASGGREVGKSAYEVIDRIVSDHELVIGGQVTELDDSQRQLLESAFSSPGDSTSD